MSTLRVLKIDAFVFQSTNRRSLCFRGFSIRPSSIYLLIVPKRGLQIEFIPNYISTRESTDVNRMSYPLGQKG